MAQVLLSTEASLLSGCTRIGLASDDSVKDLRRKIVRAGGNAAVLTFGGAYDLSKIYAQVFRCSAEATAPQNIPPP